ncbi:hypothetical protein [Actinoplanes sp. NPDC026619]|uniref:hypothetical protein n=1 Tax=Actinoplanes sp. NPDC026619 TaxID=3155798 RepID=UPI00341018DF
MRVHEPEPVKLVRLAGERADRRREAITEDSQRARAVAGPRDQRSIGVTRRPVRDDADEM